MFMVVVVFCFSDEAVCRESLSTYESWKQEIG